MKMRTIGVLGGIGPQATMDFEARLHAVSQRFVPRSGNTGYPPLITLYLRHPPVRVDDQHRPLEPLAVDPRLLEAAAQLGRLADFLVIPSNTPHLFAAEIEAAAGCEIVSIIDATMEELKRRHARRVGLVGLGVPQIYVDRCEKEGMEVSVASRAQRNRLDRAILAVMEGSATDDDETAARTAVESVRATGVMSTILGCTEIPLLLGAHGEASHLINPAQLLAEAAVRHAIDERG